MASSIPVPSRALLEALRPVQRRPKCKCTRFLSPLTSSPLQRSRHVSTVSPRAQEMEVDKESRPRWAETPAAMKVPFRARAKPLLPGHEAYKSSGDPKKLDDAYNKFLGKDGSKMLSDETKWLAVTHKSFDHGRRGFNDRLSFLGKKIFELQACLSLLSVADSSHYLKDYQDPHGRIPFNHPATASIECLSGGSLSVITHHAALSELAQSYGIAGVVRWMPKNPDALKASGCDMVYAQALYAIIGAISLEQGGAVAVRVTRERVLARIGRKVNKEEANDQISTS